jgi:hypothetical protein
MSGSWKQVKLAGRRPLDECVEHTAATPATHGSREPQGMRRISLLCVFNFEMSTKIHEPAQQERDDALVVSAVKGAKLQSVFLDDNVALPTIFTGFVNAVEEARPVFSHPFVARNFLKHLIDCACSTGIALNGFKVGLTEADSEFVSHGLALRCQVGLTFELGGG